MPSRNVRSVRIVSPQLHQKKSTTFCGVLFLTTGRFEPSNADVRWTSAPSRLDGKDSLYCANGTMAPNLLRSTKKEHHILWCFFDHREIRTIKCRCPVDICSFPSSREGLFWIQCKISSLLYSCIILCVSCTFSH